MKNKLIVFAICFCVLLSVFTLSAFALDDDVSYYVVDPSSPSSSFIATSSETDGIYLIFSLGNDVFPRYGHSVRFGNQVITLYDESGTAVDYYGYVELESITITLYAPLSSGSSELANWLIENNSNPLPDSEPLSISNGYYSPSGAPTVSDSDVLSIGVGNTLSYEMPALNSWVNADGFGTYIDNIAFKLVSANSVGSSWHLEVFYNDGYEYVRLVTIHKAASGTFNIVLDNSFRMFYFEDSFEVDSLGYRLFVGLFDYSSVEPDVDPPIPDVGNVLYTFLEGVASALDADIFGYFSILDLLKVLVGACFVVWLLKMLAGG